MVLCGVFKKSLNDKVTIAVFGEATTEPMPLWLKEFSCPNPCLEAYTHTSMFGGRDYSTKSGASLTWHEIVGNVVLEMARRSALILQPPIHANAMLSIRWLE